MKKPYKWINNNTWEKKLYNGLPLLAALGALAFTDQMITRFPTLCVIAWVSVVMIQVSAGFALLYIRMNEEKVKVVDKKKIEAQAFQWVAGNFIEEFLSPGQKVSLIDAYIAGAQTGGVEIKESEEPPKHFPCFQLAMCDANPNDNLICSHCGGHQ